MFPNPIYLFGIPFQLFGIFAAVSIFIGYHETEREMRRTNIQADILPDLMLAILMGAFLCARLLFVVFNYHHYAFTAWDVFKFWEGGLVLHGGLLGGLLGGYILCRVRKVSFIQLSDPVAMGLASGLTLSRLGCLAAGCCFGKPTSLPWGMTFNHAESLAAPLHVPLHPTQLYLFFLGIAGYFLLLHMRSRKTFTGELILIYFITVSASRLFVDFFRADSQGMMTGTILTVFVLSSVFYLQLKTNQQGKSMKMKLPVLRVAAYVLVAYMMTACGIVKTQQISRGLNIAESDVNRIVKGQTTEKEIMKMFGPPTKVRDTAEGQEFFYDFTKSGGLQLNLVVSAGGSTVTKTLLVWLDKQGVVTDYAYKAS
jgi:phosphatidylglycerol---prolipoprotein diacylglyceryl transferase